MSRFIIANWKMNPLSESAAIKLQKDIQKQVSGFRFQVSDLNIVICPPAIYLKAISETIRKDSHFKLGAQDCFYEEAGTFTGEISAKMLADMGVKYCIVGHSERKRIFGETIEDVCKKVKVLLKYKITPVVCAGEIERGKKLEGVDNQVNKILESISKSNASRMIFAYEPAWAISDGKKSALILPSQNDILGAKLLIRKCLAKKISAKKAMAVPIIYGGSVNASNVAKFVGGELMDGALVGGASLKANEFGKIIEIISNDKF